MLASADSRTMARRVWKAGVAAGVVAFVVLAAPRTEAHKGIASKYNFNEHIFPILRDRCGSCHYKGGPAPMSLVDYLDAVPWAESIREALISQHMPPWYVDPMGPAVKGAGHTIPPRELDMLLSWVVGGTPRFRERIFAFIEESTVTSPSYAGPAEQWAAGPPNVTVEMPAAHSLGIGVREEDQEFLLDPGLTEETWISSVDFMPGNRSMVREALVSLENGPILAAWEPGYEAIPAPNGTAFRLPAGSKLKLQIHYKKNWQDEAKELTDKSTVGLYTTDAPLSGRSLEEIVVEHSNGESDPTSERVLTANLAKGSRIVAFRPTFDQEYEAMSIDAVLPNGRRAELLRLRSPQPQWARRYWLAEPVELPANTKIEIKATPTPPDPFAIPVPKRHPLGVSIDLVTQ
ncbi:MAG: hypothetical protein AB7F99_03340 [Vicinamibacterales bacterium]